MRFTFAKSIYNKEALLRAAYAYTDKTYIHLDADEQYYFVDIKMKNDSDKSIDLEAFQNEILAQMIREDVREKTKNIRELILARAFSSTLISESPTYQPERNTVDINDILVDWFEKYE